MQRLSGKPWIDSEQEGREDREGAENAFFPFFPTFLFKWCWH